MPSLPPVFDPFNPAHAALYDEMPLWSALAGQLLLEHVPLPARGRVLDVGCGTGFPLLELAERLGPAVHVLGVDPWAGAMARANAKVRTWGVPNAALVRGDGARLPLPAASCALVVSNLGVNNFADPHTALRECRRVLEPTGTLALSTNIVGHMRELYFVFEQVLTENGDAAGLGRLRDHVAHRRTVGELEAMLETAGLRVERVHSREVLLRFRTARALFTHHFMRFGFVPAWREVAGSDERLEAIRERLEDVASSEGELRLTVPLIVMLARPADA